MLVEDSEELALAWQDVLSLDGHNVTYFLNGRDALSALPTLGPLDVLVCDYYVPDLNGLEIISRVRQQRPTLPVILLTGAKDPFIQECVANLGNALLLHKPLRLEQLEAGLAEMTRPDERSNRERATAVDT
jgi:CheY-like chemotaxis protein